MNENILVSSISVTLATGQASTDLQEVENIPIESNTSFKELHPIYTVLHKIFISEEVFVSRKLLKQISVPLDDISEHKATGTDQY